MTADVAELAELVEDERSRDGRPQPWLAKAACVGVDSNLFFPERGASTREAKAVCARCSAQLECLVYALAWGEKIGIWGGMSERERRRVRRAVALARRDRKSAAA